MQFRVHSFVPPRPPRTGAWRPETAPRVVGGAVWAPQYFDPHEHGDRRHVQLTEPVQRHDTLVVVYMYRLCKKRQLSLCRTSYLTGYAGYVLGVCC